MCNMFMYMYMYVRVVIEVAFNYVCLMHVLLNKLEDTLQLSPLTRIELQFYCVR